MLSTSPNPSIFVSFCPRPCQYSLSHSNIILIKQYWWTQKKVSNGKAGPSKSTPVKAKPTPAKSTKAGGYKLVVKPPMPTKTAKSPKSSKAKPTAVEVLMSKINPTAAVKVKTTTITTKSSNGKTIVTKTSGKVAVKPTVQAKVNVNGKTVTVEKRVHGNGKSSAEKSSNGNGKATVVSKINGNGSNKAAVVQKANGKATVQVKEITVKVNSGNSNTNGNGKAVGKEASNQAKSETTKKGKTEKNVKVEKTVVSAVKSTAKASTSKAPKPTKASAPEATTMAKASTTKATTGKTQLKAEVKLVKTVVTKVPLVKSTVSKVEKNVVKKFSIPRKVATTSVPVRPTPPRPTTSKMGLDINVKSQHKPFPPFGKTALRGTAVPAKKVTNGYQQVQKRRPMFGFEWPKWYVPAFPPCFQVFLPPRICNKMWMSFSSSDIMVCHVSDFFARPRKNSRAQCFILVLEGEPLFNWIFYKKICWSPWEVDCKITRNVFSFILFLFFFSDLISFNSGLENSPLESLEL